ncbi:hypothetical protein B7767_38325, partial [Streptomyces sp. 13-12-16]
LREGSVARRSGSGSDGGVLRLRSGGYGGVGVRRGEVRGGSGDPGMLRNESLRTRHRNGLDGLGPLGGVDTWRLDGPRSLSHLTGLRRSGLGARHLDGLRRLGPLCGLGTRHLDGLVGRSHLGSLRHDGIGARHPNSLGNLSRLGNLRRSGLGSLHPVGLRGFGHPTGLRHDGIGSLRLDGLGNLSHLTGLCRSGLGARRPDGLGRLGPLCGGLRSGLLNSLRCLGLLGLVRCGGHRTRCLGVLRCLGPLGGHGGLLARRLAGLWCREAGTRYLSAVGSVRPRNVFGSGGLSGVRHGDRCLTGLRRLGRRGVLRRRGPGVRRLGGRGRFRFRGSGPGYGCLGRLG